MFSTLVYIINYTGGMSWVQQGTSVWMSESCDWISGTFVLAQFVVGTQYMLPFGTWDNSLKFLHKVAWAQAQLQFLFHLLSQQCTRRGDGSGATSAAMAAPLFCTDFFILLSKIVGRAGIDNILGHWRSLLAVRRVENDYLPSFRQQWYSQTLIFIRNPFIR